MTDSMNEQDPKIIDLNSHREKRLNEESQTPKKVIEKFRQYSDNLFSKDLYPNGKKRIDEEKLFMVTQETWSGYIMREYTGWRENESGDVELIREMSLDIDPFTDYIDVSWPKREPNSKFEDDIVEDHILFHEDGELAALINGKFIEWDNSGEFIKGPESVVYNGQEYKMPKHLEISEIRATRFPNELLKNPFNAPTELDVSWKTPNPIEFLGLKPKE